MRIPPLVRQPDARVYEDVSVPLQQQIVAEQGALG